MKKIKLPKGYEIEENIIFEDNKALCLGYADRIENDFWFYFNPETGEIEEREDN